MCASPKIVSFEWGSVIVEKDDGSRVKFGDAMLAPSMCCEWDWKTYDMHHSPGILPQFIKDLVEKGGAEEIILSAGMNGKLELASAGCGYLLENAIPFRVMLSPAAVEKYNEKREEGVAIGLLLHSTC